MMVFTCPGKLGDACLQLPVARRWCLENETKCAVWADQGTCKSLIPLLESQSWVSATRLLPGIQHYRCGGQPWDFGFQVADHLDNEIVHLGFRSFPQLQITLQTLQDVPLNIDGSELATQETFEIDGVIESNRLILHGTFQAPMSGTPGFWRFLGDRRKELEGLFEEIVFVGSPNERKRALEVYPEWTAFDDNGSFLDLARLMKGSRAVIGAGSSNVALASVLHVPCIRVHDDIGGLPWVIWSGLGDNQLNETERDLREAWSAWRDAWILPTAMSV